MDIGTFLGGTTVNFTINGFTASSASPIASMATNSSGILDPAVVLPLAVDIVISDTGFLLPSNPLTLFQTVNLLSSVGGLTANATAVGFYGGSNTNFDVAGPATSTASSALAAGIATNLPGTSPIILGAPPYSLTTYIHVDILSRGADPLQILQINQNLSASAANVPEPASFMLFGTGLLGFAALLRKKSRRPE
jgi:hypothetical protein